MLVKGSKKKKGDGKNISTIPVKVPPSVKEGIRSLVELGLYSSASEFVRDAIYAYFVLLYRAIPEYEEALRIVDELIVEYMKNPHTSATLAKIIERMFNDPRVEQLISSDPLLEIPFTRLISSFIDPDDLRKVFEEEIFEKVPIIAQLVFEENEAEREDESSQSEVPPHASRSKTQADSSETGGESPNTGVNPHERV